ncbi:hypothetical protein KFL_000850370 [Klebsormidium nitens]|uniref:Sugar phosphate transporter domain-containing protein n=1 Tax=Klebsormidium nitens TaxID=105231 RepID=A0A1Y1HXD0_KLENI|nr:hypothetical protein KFL_000850370 [Klebsormidium nitens]|eukprot:GAQ81621.1 hypothetical protein KFL_000850370 [Klebsormidium nitens]
MQPAAYHRRDDAGQSSMESTYGAEDKGPPDLNERPTSVNAAFRGASTSQSDADHFWSPTGKRAYSLSDDEEFDLLDSTYRNAWTHWVSANPLAVKLIKTLSLITLWYLFSILLSLYNKFLLGAKMGKFPAPLLMTTCHFIMQFCFSALLLHSCGSYFRPSSKLTWFDYVTKVLPTGTGTAIDVGLSNLSLVLVTVSFYTMCKSSAPVFLVLFAFLFRLEKPSWSLAGVIVIICVGEIFTVAGETQFNLWGFILVMLASGAAGFRWTLTQILLQREKLGLNNPVITMYYLTPVMAGSLGLLSVCTEPLLSLGSTPYFNTRQHALRSIGLMLFGGCLAFCMIMSEFLLISETSAITLTIAGVVKECVTIVVSVIIFGDEFGFINVLGLVIVIAGVGIFNLIKYQRMHAGHTGGDSSERQPLNASSYELLDRKARSSEETADPSLLEQYRGDHDQTLSEVFGETTDVEDGDARTH